MNDKTQNFLYIEISADQVRINYNIVTNNDEAVSSCESEVVKIKPVLVGADYTYKATTVCSPANAGTSACAPNKSVENSYILVANTADGWSFEKWTASNDTQTLSTSNVYETAALTDNTEFTAHFHEWYKPSIVCVDETGAELQNFNTTTVTRIENDTWRLSALGTKMDGYLTIGARRTAPKILARIIRLHRRWKRTPCIMRTISLCILQESPPFLLIPMAI